MADCAMSKYYFEGDFSSFASLFIDGPYDTVRRVYRPGDMVSSQGETLNNGYYIASGVLQLKIGSEVGKERSLDGKPASLTAHPFQGSMRFAGGVAVATAGVSACDTLLQRRMNFAQGGATAPKAYKVCCRVSSGYRFGICGRNVPLQRRMSFSPDDLSARNAKAMRLWSGVAG